jgi:MOSC domain-containing protein YiiM
MARLIGIARTHELRAPMEELPRAAVSVEAGIDGDARGRKLDRQITVLFREGWEDACKDLGVSLPWITRRANLYVEGLDRPRQTGGTLKIGDVVLEVMRETDPCQLMEQAHAGLYNAMKPDWRGGVCCRVIAGGEIAVGDAVALSG